ncbi:uncharacterized protein LOC135497688 [Lineus longissimus]|uniref:uncharacterized protein LOC135497688 n=1 Tax=Lineus longissimus TaxID=88925 RepID=UPI00315D2E46
MPRKSVKLSTTAESHSKPDDEEVLDLPHKMAESNDEPKASSSQAPPQPSTPSKLQTSSKTPQNTLVEGYVQEVTDIATSQKGNKYLRAQLQTGPHEYKELVCFSPSPKKQQELLNMQNNKKAVKILNFSHDKQNPTKILCNDTLTFENASPTFPFTPKINTPPPVSTIAQIKSIENKSLVTVDVRIMEKLETKTITTHYNKELQKTTFTAADTTGSITLSTWDENTNKLTLDKSFRIMGGTIEPNYGGQINTDKQTTFQEIQQINNVLHTPTKTTVEGEIVGAELTPYNACPLCKQQITDNTLLIPKFCRCPSCSLKFKSENIYNRLSAKLQIKLDGQKNLKCTASQDSLKNILDTIISADLEIIEEFLLDLGRAAFSLNSTNQLLQIQTI